VAAASQAALFISRCPSLLLPPSPLPPSPLPSGNELDGWNGTDRDHFDAAISAQDLADSYLVPFEACVTKGQASGIMCR
jgi:hypothetical protein